MKVKLDIDLTPLEARQLMGLPDVEPMQEQIMKKLQDKMNHTIDGMTDPEMFFKHFFPVGLEGFENMQKMMNSFVSAGLRSNTKKD